MSEAQPSLIQARPEHDQHCPARQGGMCLGPPTCGVKPSLVQDAPRYWLRRSWTRLWWVAVNPDEALATMDTNTHYRAWSRDRLIAKLRRMNEPKDGPWEEIRV